VLEVATSEQLDCRPSALDCGELENLTVPEGAPSEDETVKVQVTRLPTVAAEEGQTKDAEVDGAAPPLPPPPPPPPPPPLTRGAFPTAMLARPPPVSAETGMSPQTEIPTVTLMFAAAVHGPPGSG
jgi:hypothetical protein